MKIDHKLLKSAMQRCGVSAEDCVLYKKDESLMLQVADKIENAFIAPIGTCKEGIKIKIQLGILSILLKKSGTFTIKKDKTLSITQDNSTFVISSVNYSDAADDIIQIPKEAVKLRFDAIKIAVSSAFDNFLLYLDKGAVMTALINPKYVLVQESASDKSEIQFDGLIPPNYIKQIDDKGQYFAHKNFFYIKHDQAISRILVKSTDNYYSKIKSLLSDPILVAKFRAGDLIKIAAACSEKVLTLQIDAKKDKSLLLCSWSKYGNVHIEEGLSCKGKKSFRASIDRASLLHALKNMDKVTLYLNSTRIAAILSSNGQQAILSLKYEAENDNS
jgi:hypothetical protein